MSWIITKYPTACAECAQPIPESTHALYNPKERKIYCASCGFAVEDGPQKD